MTDIFELNGYKWSIVFVQPNDPMLIDRTNRRTVATTDIQSKVIYLSTQLHGDELYKVLIHEISHCAIYSFGLDNDIHKAVYPEYWIEAEEWLCNYLFDYGYTIFKAAARVMGVKALNYIPKEYERLIA